MLQKMMGVAFSFLAVLSVGLTSVLLFNIGVWLLGEHGGIAIVVVVAGAVATTGLFCRRRQRAAARLPSAPHPGISMHAIPIAGGMGLLFAIAYVVMFWFGAPGYRPIVLGAAGAGALLGFLLIRRARSRPQRNDTSILHLDREAEDPTRADRLQPRETSDSRFASKRWALAPGRVASGRT